VRPYSVPLSTDPRPTTSNTVARRLIAGALGMRASKKPQKQGNEPKKFKDNQGIRRV
jgi:hypothetical protein